MPKAHSSGVQLRKVSFPSIGRPAEPRPEVPGNVFEARLAKVREAMKRRGLDALIVYGDREHMANLHYLTNYDPRFEESILIILPEGTPTLLVGNEGMAYSEIARLKVERRLYQSLSLLGQPREKVTPLGKLLRELGLSSRRKIGVAGWKYFSEREIEDAAHALDLPDFLARSIRSAGGPGADVTNQTDLFMDPHHGLRNTHEPEQLAEFEWIATHNSQSLLEGLRGLKIGDTEHDAFSRMTDIGLPFGCHPIVAAGSNETRYMLASPSSRKIGLGEPLMMTYSFAGANCCRCGFFARGPADLPGDAKDYVERCAAPYFAAMAAWYEAMRVGATGDELHQAVRGRLDPAGFTIGLNAGHQIAYDEWTHSPVEAGNTKPIQSGAYFQCDFFGLLPGPCFASFCEDGLFVADEELRRTLKQRYPAMMGRIETRRRFMIETLGIRLQEDVLPVANFAGATLPYLLAADECLCVVR